jgi:hypothetical protein
MAATTSPRSILTRNPVCSFSQSHPGFSRNMGVDGKGTAE